MRLVIPHVFPAGLPERSAERERKARGESSGSSFFSWPRMSEAELGELTALWREVDTYFASRSDQPMFNLGDPESWFAVSVDVSGVIEQLERWDDPSFERRQDCPWGAVLDVEFSRPEGDDRFGGDSLTVEQFVQQFWLAMNLAAPGWFDLEDAWDDDDPQNEALPKLRAFGRDSFAGAALLHPGWPPLARLPFSVTWDWLHADMFYDLRVAKNPSQIALVTLLQIARRDWLDPANVLSIAQALEALLAAGRDSIGATIRGRVDAILNVPPERKKLIGRFYDFRSRIVHGDYPHVRPTTTVSLDWGDDPERMRVEQELPSVYEDGLRILLALIQDLIRHNGRRYVFTESFRRE
jgi:hypothetical protein